MADGLYWGASGSVMRLVGGPRVRGRPQVVFSAHQQAVDHALDAGGGQRRASREGTRRPVGTQPRSSTTPRATASGWMPSPARRGSASSAAATDRAVAEVVSRTGIPPHAAGDALNAHAIHAPTHSLRPKPARSPAPMPRPLQRMISAPPSRSRWRTP